MSANQDNGAAQTTGKQSALKRDTPNFAPKRFYKDVTLEARSDGVVVLLDGRPIRTPAKNEFVLPSDGLADAVAQEWRDQTERINPASMPLTRIVNSSIDGVAGRMPEVCADIAKYAGTDLLCYRAESPRELVARQSECWDPVLDKVGAMLGVRFAVVDGLMPVAQDPSASRAVADWLRPKTPLQVGALHVVTTLTGSVCLAIALAERWYDPAETWRVAHVDEDFQAEKWGSDREAQARRAWRWQEMQAAARILTDPA